MNTKKRYEYRVVDDQESYTFDDAFGELPKTFGINLTGSKDYGTFGFSPAASNLTNKLFRQRFYMLPVYAYMHGQIALKAKLPGEELAYPFNDEWDAGRIGSVYIGKKELMTSRVTKVKRTMPAAKRIQLANNWLQKMTVQVGEFLNGEFYGWEVYDTEDSDEVVESCWGYLGAGGRAYADRQGAETAHLMNNPEDETED